MSRMPGCCLHRTHASICRPPHHAAFQAVFPSAVLLQAAQAGLVDGEVLAVAGGGMVGLRGFWGMGVGRAIAALGLGPLTAVFGGGVWQGGGPLQYQACAFLGDEVAGPLQCCVLAP